MKITVQNLSKTKVSIQCEIQEEEFKPFIEKATLELGQGIQIDGFRKGNLPKEMIEKKIGESGILNKAAEICVKEKYPLIISEKNLEPITSPEIEILKLAKGNPFEIKITIDILPDVELPDYQKIASKIERKDVEVSKEEIEKIKEEKQKAELIRNQKEILEKIADQTEIEIPEALIELEKSRAMENLKQNIKQSLHISFEEYLKKINKSEKEMLDSFLPEIQRKIKNYLIIKAVQSKENINCSEQEINEEVDKVLKENAGFEKNEKFDLNKVRGYIKDMIIERKTLEKLQSFNKNN
ncbi:MAG: trigger factor [Patescibacteria group bacterium]|nr:trigger factor [Patescibacteria group bacterium]